MAPSYLYKQTPVNYHTDTVLEIRTRNWSAIFEDGMFYRLLITACSIENVQEIWPIKKDFGRPNAEIGQKIANGRLISSTAVSW